jgi:hypothetical protein
MKSQEEIVARRAENVRRNIGVQPLLWAPDFDHAKPSLNPQKATAEK